MITRATVLQQVITVPQLRQMVLHDKCSTTRKQLAAPLDWIWLHDCLCTWLWLTIDALVVAMHVSILALSPFGRNGGAFFASPSSLQQARALTEAMTVAEQAEIMEVPDRTRTRLRQALTPQIDRSDAIEVTVEAGDCIILDPMCTFITMSFQRSLVF